MAESSGSPDHHSRTPATGGDLCRKGEENRSPATAQGPGPGILPAPRLCHSSIHELAAAIEEPKLCTAALNDDDPFIGVPLHALNPVAVRRRRIHRPFHEPRNRIDLPPDRSPSIRAQRDRQQDPCAVALHERREGIIGFRVARLACAQRENGRAQQYCREGLPPP